VFSFKYEGHEVRTKGEYYNKDIVLFVFSFESFVVKFSLPFLVSLK